MRQKLSQIILCLGLSLLLVACAGGPEMPEFPSGKTLAPKKATSRPYQIKGVWYYPQPYFEYAEEGIASFYGGGDIFHGRPTATGERFDMNGLTAAHKTLPLPCFVRVKNLENGRELMVKVNDRGPFPPGRLIDLSRRCAQLLGFEHKGLARVHIVTLVPESLALNGINSSSVRMAQIGTSPVVNNKIAPNIKSEPLIEQPIEEEANCVEDIFAQEPISVDQLPPPVLVAKAPLFIQNTQNTPPLSTGIFVYVGAFENQVKAKAISRSLQGMGNCPVGIVKHTGPKPYAARLGPLASMANANQLLDQLVNTGHPSSRIIIQR